jgi:hypothetical protein
VALASDVTGTWKGTTKGQNGEDMALTFNFKVDGSTLTGNISGPMGDLPISAGKVDGDTISFNVETDQFKAVHKGTVSGDTIKLNVEIGDTKFDMDIKRAAS